MASDYPKCPVCGSYFDTGALVCRDCGQVYCGQCVNKIRENHADCPRCGSRNKKVTGSWEEIAKALRGELPLD